MSTTMSKPTAATRDLDAARRAARIELEQGRWASALAMWQAFAVRVPHDAEAARAIAALLHQLGHAAEGKAHVREFFRRYPLQRQPAAVGPSRGVICAVEGCDGSTWMIGQNPNGTAMVKARGARFLTSYLLDWSTYDRHTWTIVDETSFTRSPLQGAHIVLNRISDVDLEGDALRRLDAFLAQHPNVPVINRPRGVMDTTRDANHRRLGDIPDVLFPRTERLDRDESGDEGLVAKLRALDLTWPVILRATGTQTGRTVALVDNMDDALDWFRSQASSSSFYAIEFFDHRIDGKWFNKKRVFFIDGRMYPVVSHVDDIWNVHGSNRMTVMKSTPWMMEQEARFVQDAEGVLGPRATAALQEIARRTELDFFGMDFTVLDDGRVLVYELNPSMRHSFDHGKNFPYLLPSLHRISDAFRDMVDDRIARARRSKR
jgi:hypothetical protein